MNRFRKITMAARLGLATLAALAVAPAAAAARDCAAEQIQCIVDYGSGSQCLHEYIDCLMRGILNY
jgi:hypothetical protein